MQDRLNMEGVWPLAKYVDTVRGSVEVTELGVTDYHEHIYVELPTWLFQLDPDLSLSDPDRSVAELKDWHRAGGKTVIDMTAPDFGRNISVIQRIADQVPEINILLTTGFNRPWYMGRWVFEVSEADMIRIVVAEATKGIQGTSVKAAVIKAGTEYNLWDEAGRKLLRVAAAAYRETGKPIITHTTAGTLGDRQVEYLQELGVPANRICLSHMDRNPDFGVHKAIAETGAWLGYDCFGKIKYGPDSIRIELLRNMIEAGLGDRILIGNDLARASYFKHYGGGLGLDYLLTSFVPRLRAEGFTDESIHRLLVDNPRRFFSGEA